MCQEVVILAKSASQRYISQCEHGTVHLLWDGLGFHLPAQRFCALAEVIEQAWREMSAAPYPHPGGFFRLQVNSIVMGIPSDQFVLLRELIATALPHVDMFAGIAATRFAAKIGRVHTTPLTLCAN
jgi:hypothetical protein